MYIDDSNGFPLYSTPNDQIHWFMKAYPYLGQDSYVKPSSAPGNLWICPKNPEGEFWGNSPSYSTSGGLIIGNETVSSLYYRVAEFDEPGKKTHIFEANHWYTRSNSFSELSTGGVSV